MVERGVEVPEDLKLYAYPDLVKNIQGGGSGGETNFYKCASVGSAVGGGGGGNIIRVSGAGHIPANGDYVQTDPTATGWNRVWQLQNASFVIAANTDYAGGEYWYLAPELGGYADEYIYYGLGTNPENPWEVDSWEANRGVDEPIPTFEVAGGGSSESDEEIRLFYNSDIGSWEFRGAGGGYYMELLGNRNPPVGSGFEFPDGEYGENMLSLEWGADGTSIIVSGATDHPQVNGTYALHEGSGTDSNSVWLKAPASSESSENTWSGYKAVLVTATETTEIPGGSVVIVSGAAEPGMTGYTMNGTYHLQDSTATGFDRVWVMTDRYATYYIYNMDRWGDGRQWCLSENIWNAYPEYMHTGAICILMKMRLMMLL